MKRDVFKLQMRMNDGEKQRRLRSRDGVRKAQQSPTESRAREEHKCQGSAQLALEGSSRAIRQRWGVDGLTAAPAHSALGHKSLADLQSSERLRSRGKVWCLWSGV